MAGFFEAVLLGIVQGVTEWLPVSSKGNVSILAQFLGMPVKEAFAYAIILHVGTLIAAAVYFRKDIAGMISGKDNEKRNFVFWTLAATAVTAVPSYFVLKKLLETASITFFGVTFHSQTIFLFTVGFFLAVTGFLQLAKKRQKEARLSGKNAVLLGLSQGFTVLPGMSRSGTTASVMLFEGFSPEKAFELSFLISVPTVLFGELAFNLLERPVLEPSMVAGIAAAAVTGFFSIGFLIGIAKKINFGKFCIGLALFYFAVAAATFAVPALA
ncbi:MAG: undecaprenyl-diphosphate phosphatase [Candidatus Diapherotrites archaeon]|nr:undecaprenyl-diphosphate phosphatase [Candidatus Diapherotrites archaeon]